MPPTPQTTETQGGGGRPPEHTPRRLIQSERGRASPFAPSEPRQEDGGGGCPPEPGPPPAPQNGAPSRSSRAPRAPGPHCAQNLTPRRCSRNPPAPAPTSDPPGRASCGRRTTWLSHLGRAGYKTPPGGASRRRGTGVHAKRPFDSSMFENCIRECGEKEILLELEPNFISFGRKPSCSHKSQTPSRGAPLPLGRPGVGGRKSAGRRGLRRLRGAVGCRPTRRPRVAAGAEGGPAFPDERARGPLWSASGSPRCPAQPAPHAPAEAGILAETRLLVEARDSEPRPGRAARLERPDRARRPDGPQSLQRDARNPLPTA